MKSSDQRDNSMGAEINRRTFLKLGLISAAATVLPCDKIEAVNNVIYDNKAICVYNLHSKEYRDVIFRREGEYDKEGLRELNYIFRDHYNGSVREMDPRLFDFLYAIQKKLQTKEPFHLISGYRSSATNKKLRKNNRGVARRSLHMKGKAADIRIPGIETKLVRRTAYELQTGGVGYYPRSNFVHIDVGRIRFWRG